MDTSTLENNAVEQKGSEQKKAPEKEGLITPEQLEGAVDSAKKTITSDSATAIDVATLSFSAAEKEAGEDNQDLVATATTELEGIEEQIRILGDAKIKEIDVATEVLEIKETAVEIPKEIADALIAHALDQVRVSFNAPENDEQRLDFHNTAHTEGVVDRTDKIMQAMGGNERDVTLAKIIAAGHDIKQNYEVDQKLDGKRMRKRAIRKNEKDSANEVIAMMKNVNKQQENEGKQVIFSETDFKVAEEAVDATVPGWDPETEKKKGTVIQPKLTTESSAIARALALADLGEAGMDPEGYLAGGDALFREENLDMRNCDSATLTDEQKDAYKKRMLAWSIMQESFAQGRQQRLEKEIDGLPEDAKKNVRELFTQDNFEKSIKGAQEKATKRASMTFKDLYKDMGFSS